MKIVQRVLCAALIGALSSTQPACFGSFKLTRGIYNFNREVSGNKFLRWLVFLGLVIIPVYAIGSLGDALIFNTLEFWGGGAPEGASVLNDHEKLVFHRSEDDVLTVELVRDGEVVSTWVLEPAAEGLALRDTHGALIAYASDAENGEVVVKDASGAVLAQGTP
jgi:hypothetical protein